MWIIVVLSLLAGFTGITHAAERPVVKMTTLAQPPEVPPPLTRRTPAKVEIVLEMHDVKGTLADRVEYQFWTYGGTVPGPLIRIRVGDVVTLHLKNHERNTRPHSIDLHAVNGPGGGATVTQAEPGETKTFHWKALNPGLYIYHCATPRIPHHIAHGMYGLILVEPDKGLPPVDKEFYIVQSEFYTKGKFGEKGLQMLDPEALLRETPAYVVLNGRVGALAGPRALKAKVGDRVRLFVGNAGPNLISAFHIIGEVFDRVYPEGAIGTPPLQNIQTTLIPPGGAAIVEFRLDVPGRYLLVDHAISRAIDKGALGMLEASGSETPEVFRGER